MCKLMIHFSFLCFWKNSRNRLAELKDRQAAHATSAYFLGFDMHRLAAKGSPLGDTNWVTQFLLILGIFVMCEVRGESGDLNITDLMDC